MRADQDEVNFANAPLCIELAIAHGNAVDFPKSGYCPEISSSLFVNEYPEFMEKDDAVIIPINIESSAKQVNIGRAVQGHQIEDREPD